ncbi:unnamed protein product [Sphagnum jensenii]|uniref:3-hydroxyisobutyrate dehydrogenase n=1 Tax=Sphagnum jensenii TaxID=128206 RepID=A0ABP1BG87_9BRYO
MAFWRRGGVGWWSRSLLLRNCITNFLPLQNSGLKLFCASSGDDPQQRVGFVGLGNMGAHMASNLLKAGHHLTVHDKNEGVMRAFAEKGADMAPTPHELADACDVVITMLPSSPHVVDVYMGPKGLLSASDSVRPSLLIDASTVDPQTCRRLAKRVAECKLSSSSKQQAPLLLDAPVSGGVVGAQAATLTFMVGGSEEALKGAQHLLKAMGTRVVHCGGAGNGAAAKVCNNLALAISMAGVSEALALGQRLGIDAHTLSNIFNSSSARCWSSDTYNPVPGVMSGVPASRNYQGGFSCHLMVKDVGLAMAAADESGSSVPLGLQVFDMYTAVCKAGQSSDDFSVIFQHYYKGKPEQEASIDLKPQRSITENL